MDNQTLARKLAVYLPLITPALRSEAKVIVDKLRAKAAETKNPVDDALVGILGAFLGV